MYGTSTIKCILGSIFPVCNSDLDPISIDPRKLDPKSIFEQVDGSAIVRGDNTQKMEPR